MFERVIFLLLEGNFICHVSQPEAYSFLNDENNLKSVEDYLARIERRVARTSKQTGFYLAFAEYGDKERAKIRTSYADIKNSLGPVVAFFQAIIRATGQESLLMQGSIIEVDTLMGRIDQDASLRSELQSVGVRFKIAADASHRKMMEAILKRMVNDQYLILNNPERSIYLVTSKIEYLLDVIKFISETDETVISSEAEDEALAEWKTGALL